ncbi:hypothetical protein K461DRAFT_316784 [Myriangium duriaei CBS 260.36]|uniref:Zn(2)-C6 fungal-type domain-containing protein n=1 Tax=Myriangium duriaei CBS 260.36 TaxID=1168546 RepID=A0A9P4J9I7_9PEZI|nr:hypothetical protein K461DRAFT_316784 [Myriangium duriaei CBS 260.36]
MPVTSSANIRTRRGRKNRAHALGGCASCRRRHVKCDQTKPSCKSCQSAGLECEGYQHSIQWGPSVTATSETHTRRHLYSEDARKHMSNSLSAELTSGCVDASLLEVDAKAKNQTSNDAVHVGPFGVFSVSAPTSSNTSGPSAVSVEALTEANDAIQHIDIQDCAVDVPTGDSFSDLDSALFNVGDFLNWDDLFDVGISGFDGNVSASLQDQQYDPLQFPSPTPGSSFLIGSGTIHPQTTAATTTTTATEAEVLAAAPSLLKNFKSVLSHFAPVPTNSASPWSMNLSAAVRTLADLTFMESTDVNNANQANLFGILACSASELTRVHHSQLAAPVSQHERIIKYCADRAKGHMQQSLMHETQPPQKAKYKDQLMAIFSLIAFATGTGNQKDARCYIIDSEKLLRVRGLQKREVSRRARLLHHIYSWIRIVGESTFVTHEYTSSNLLAKVNGMLHSTEHSRNRESSDDNVARLRVELDDFLRTEDGSEEEEELTSPKAQDEGLRDIHLEDVREWSGTLYTKIYGIPETWLSLVSRTTRLANVLDVLDAHCHEEKSKSTARVHKKVDQLEHLICMFASRRQVVPEKSCSTREQMNDDIRHAREIASVHMVNALKSAVLIFFYRRLRKVHPFILQGHVQDVIESLRLFDTTMDQYQVTGLRTPWPAFVAGCEATSSGSQEMLMSWIDKSFTQSGVSAYKAAQDVMREVWKRRQEVGRSQDVSNTGDISSSGRRRTGMQVSWVDVLRERRQWLMLY